MGIGLYKEVTKGGFNQVELPIKRSTVLKIKTKTKKTIKVGVIQLIDTLQKLFHVGKKFLHSGLGQETTGLTLENGWIGKDFLNLEKLGSSTINVSKLEEKQICWLLFLALHWTRNVLKVEKRDEDLIFHEIQ